MSGVKKIISGTEEDIKRLLDLPEGELIRLFSNHIRNLWRVDGLYFLGIEKRFGTEPATEIDAECWRYMASVEARDLADIFEIKEKNLDAVEKALRWTSWYLAHQRKRLIRRQDELIFEVIECRTQKTRLKKGLPVFPCKRVREGYLVTFGEQFGCRCICQLCPPDPRDGEVWCRWRFVER